MNNNRACSSSNGFAAKQAIPFGVIAVAISLLFHRTASGTGWGDFLEGMFLGLALTLIVFGIIRGTAERRHG